MKKLTFIVLALVPLFFLNCKSNKSEHNFTALTKSYFDDKNALDPIAATQNGQNEYNDQFVYEMTDSYRKKQTQFFDKYEKQ